MKKKKEVLIGINLFTLFIIYTLLLKVIDVQSIGPKESMIGFATINNFIHNLFGVHMVLYNITDWLGLVPIAIGFCFGILGLIQWIKRKKICKVDGSITSLGMFYIFVIIVYIFFEYVVISRRPVLINGYLEASYPSSTTILVLCVCISAFVPLKRIIKKNIFRKIINIILILFTCFMVVGRLVSGVHWFTDIIGAIIISTSLLFIYYFLNASIEN